MSLRGPGEVLAEQAISALGALIEGLSAARGPAFTDQITSDPETIASGLRAAILRIVVLLQREGGGGAESWAALSAIFRAFVGPAPDSGAAVEEPLLDPDAHPFLDAPIDGATVARILALLRATREIEIERIGGVYEALLGVGPEVAQGASIALLPDHALVDLDAVLACEPPRRAAFLLEAASVELGARARAALEEARSVGDLAAALRKRISPRCGRILPKGEVALAPTPARRRSGSHYTPPALTKAIVEATLSPLLGESPDPARILGLRVCDPAMGSGAFLLEACRFLGDRLAVLRGDDAAIARREVAARCLYGVDRDPIAVELCRISLWLLLGGPGSPRGFLGDHLRAGDSLIGAQREDLDEHRGGPLQQGLDAWTARWFWPKDSPAPPAPEAVAAIARRERFLHWETAFPDVFGVDGRGGFDAILGNPPWVAYAGRAAQPLDAARYNFYLRRSPAFFGYRTLHGLFIHRAATLLRPGGRLGLVVPTSVSDLKGYAPVRAAHDRLCAPDPELPDFGADAFDGVFQPAMGLLSTRRATPVVAPVNDGGSARQAGLCPHTPGGAGEWRLDRAELTLEAQRLLSRLVLLPSLPASLFGERGYQTMGEDAPRLLVSERPSPPFIVPLREGRDVGPCLRRPPRIHLDPRGVAPRLRTEASFREVKLLIRQTARYPIAALGDGQPFRNSVLAGFDDDVFSAAFLLAYLNSAPIRWFHFTRYRDARQGMPQVKIAHLRGLPAPPREGAGEAWTELSALGQALGGRNRGIEGAEARILDGLVARALSLSDEELSLVRTWADANPLPRSIIG